MTYPKALRDRLISYIEDGGSRVTASKLFKVSHDTVHRWWINRDKSDRADFKRDGYKIDRKRLVYLIDNNPDMMLKELASELDVSIHSVWHSLKLLGYTRKKNGTLQREDRICQMDKGLPD